MALAGRKAVERLRFCESGLAIPVHLRPSCAAGGPDREKTRYQARKRETESERQRGKDHEETVRAHY